MNMDQKTVHSYRDLEVWEKSMALVKELYRITLQLPDDEKYGFTAQMRRAAISIPSNIAEGHARYSTREFIRFISIAHGSIAELETHLLLTKDAINPLLVQLDTIGKMLRGLSKSLQNKLRTEADHSETPSPQIQAPNTK